MKANYEEDKIIVSSTEPTGIDRKKVWIKKGKNLVNVSQIILGHALWSTDGTTLIHTERGYFDYILVNSNTEYSISNCTPTAICFYDKNKSFISAVTGETAFTTPSDCTYIRFSINITEEYSNIQFEQGAVATDCEPYIEKEIYVKNENGAYEKYMFDDVTKINNIITEFYDNTNKKIKSSSVYISNGSNIDNMVESGIYYIMSTFGGTFPSGLGGNGCVVIVATTNINYNAQLAFGFGSDKIAIRRRNGSTTWSEWKYANFN